MLRPILFEMQAADPERAMNFYGTVFGWRFDKWPGTGVDYWTVNTGGAGEPGIDGGLSRRPGPPPGLDMPLNGFRCTVEVPSVDEYVGRVTAAGGALVLETTAVPGLGWLAYCADTEGNVIGLLQRDTGAGTTA
ncbi:hypothetical protein AMJ57_04025 [Parcubacteria bacterium SG8_24]|nr:MAG: hypothetical protein AMJ57_04025 [Parcubacteria bacterium SG8_24]